MLSTICARQTLCLSPSIATSSRVQLTHTTSVNLWMHRACMSSSGNASAAVKTPTPTLDAKGGIENSVDWGNMEGNVNSKRVRGNPSKNSTDFMPPPLPIVPPKALELENYRSSRYLFVKKEGSIEGTQESPNESKAKNPRDRNRKHRPRNNIPPVLPVPPKKTLDFSKYTRGRARPDTVEDADTVQKNTLQQLERYASPKGKDWSWTLQTTPLAQLPEPAELYIPKRSMVSPPDDLSSPTTITKGPQDGDGKEEAIPNSEPISLVNPLEFRFEFVETIRTYLSTLYAKGYLTSPQFSSAGLARLNKASKFTTLMAAYSELLKKGLIKDENAYELWWNSYKETQMPITKERSRDEKVASRTKASTPKGDTEKIEIAEKSIEDALKSEPAIENERTS